jgi:hypothetical protein
MYKIPDECVKEAKIYFDNVERGFYNKNNTYEVWPDEFEGKYL